MPAKIFWNNCYAFFAVRRQVDLPSAYAKISPYSPAMWQVILNGKYQKSMLIYEERGLYFPIKYVIGTPGFQGEFVAYRDGAAAFEKELIDNGIDSLVIGVGTGPDRVTAASQEYLKMNEVLAGLIKSGRLKIVTQLPDYWVLQLSSAQEKLKKNL